MLQTVIQNAALLAIVQRVYKYKDDLIVTRTTLSNPKNHYTYIGILYYFNYMTRILAFTNSSDTYSSNYFTIIPHFWVRIRAIKINLVNYQLIKFNYIIP